MLVAPNILQVQIPLPFALKIVNCYLIAGPDGWVLIDTGLNWPPALAAWDEALARHGLRFDDVVAIYVTHYHPDHIGLAGWWQQRSGAPVFMSAVERQAALETWGGSGPAGDSMLDMFRQHGMPEAMIAEIAEIVASTRRQLQPLPTITTLEEAGSLPSVLDLAGRRFQPMLLAGHADAQLGLYEAATATLLVADHVLIKISPNISYGPRATPDPLGRYLASFAALAELPVAQVLPGHGPIFSDLAGRLDELRAHHAERLDAVAAVIEQPLSAFEVCAQIFPLASLTAHQHQFAMGEALAHLEHLVVQQRARLIEGSPQRYQHLPR